MQQPLLDLFTQAATAQGKVNTAPYAGQLYAPPNATQQAAVGLNTQAAGQIAGGDQFDKVSQLANDTISGKYLYADSNPYLKSAVDASINPLRDNLLRSILPSLQDQSIRSGAYGGSGYGTAQGLATSDFERQALDLAGKMYAGNYATERQNQLNAPALYTEANNLATVPAQLLAQSGAQQQTWQQGQDTADLNLFQINQQQPYAGLSTLANILAGGAPYSATSGTRDTTGTTGSNSGANLLQGISGAGSIANSLFPAALPAAGSWLASLFAAPTAAAGATALSSTLATLAASMAAFSDIRTKRDVRTLGWDGKGRRWVSWSYVWDAADVRHNGVIAQELPANDHGAMVVNPYGLLMVDYSKLAA